MTPKTLAIALLSTAILLPTIASASKPDSTAAKAHSTSANTKANPSTQHKMTMAEAKKKLGIVVFPAKNQTPQQQEADELACLQWSADQAGVKPGDQGPDAKAAGDAAAAKVDSAASGAAVKGAAKGAAAGAIVGAITGDAGTGAAIGAGTGAVAGRRAKKKAKEQASAQAEEQVNAQKQAKLDEVKKGMAACLESKGYTVK
ncbi:MAG TPA: glycine zipper domain-containing protein [Candidatus Eisenbacteria bacterium]|nr:glycine zipper domain-containing protein [Candidatus Eisenbacteria bacterium]